MWFDRFDICEAWYIFAMQYHSGGDTSDKIFHRLHRMQFKISCGIKDENDLNENAKAIYDNLVATHPDAQF